MNKLLIAVVLSIFVHGCLIMFDKQTPVSIEDQESTFHFGKNHQLFVEKFTLTDKTFTIFIFVERVDDKIVAQRHELVNCCDVVEIVYNGETENPAIFTYDPENFHIERKY